MSLDTMEMVKGVMPEPPTLKATVCKAGLSNNRKRRMISSRIPQLCGDVAGETCFSRAAPRVLRQDLGTRGKKSIRKEADKNIKGHQKDMVPADYAVDFNRKFADAKSTSPKDLLIRHEDHHSLCRQLLVGAPQCRGERKSSKSSALRKKQPKICGQKVKWWL